MMRESEVFKVLDPNGILEMGSVMPKMQKHMGWY